ncbi:hypothetical protein PIB30_089988 [Stylosanthes scabra]|uniref:Uncharacterized protein n=1 Tax=Stylosanthes scabra TaxID=79078 RepID=A0ABU6SWJ2_9FABA|nr:hypothetical protein [Stylosanthes scabra]
MEGSSPPRPPPSSRRPEANEPSLAAVRCRMRFHALPEDLTIIFVLPSRVQRARFRRRKPPHAPPKDGCAISLAPSPESSGTVGSEGLINDSDPSTAFNPCAFFLSNQLSPRGILIRAPGSTHQPGSTRQTRHVAIMFDSLARPD